MKILLVLSAILVVGVSRGYEIDKILQNDKIRLYSMTDYVQWLADGLKIEVKSLSKKDKSMKCIDIVFYENFTLFDDGNDFKTIVFFQFQIFNISLRLRNVDDKTEDEAQRCAIHVLVAMNTTNLLSDISKWHSIKRSTFLNILIPFQDAVDPSLWPELFSHWNMLVIVGRKVFRLSTPYQSVPRQFAEIHGGFNNVPVFGGRLSEVENFYGRQLNVSSIQCAPMHNWIDDAREAGKHIPRVGDVENICGAEKRNKSKSCSKY